MVCEAYAMDEQPAERADSASNLLSKRFITVSYTMDLVGYLIQGFVRYRVLGEVL